MISPLIRFATTADAAAIADLSRQAFFDAFASQNTPENMQLFMDRQFSRDMLIKEVGAPHNFFLLAFLNDQFAGYARLVEGENPADIGNTAAIELSRIYISSDHTGAGIGKILMQHCIDFAITKDKTWLWLGVWEHNHRAIAFYTRHGFEKFGEHVFILGLDEQTDWLMKKKL